jgi:hypothetical protein
MINKADMVMVVWTQYAVAQDGGVWEEMQKKTVEAERNEAIGAKESREFDVYKRIKPVFPASLLPC